MRLYFVLVLVMCAALLSAGCGQNPCTDADGDGFGDGCALGPDCDDGVAGNKPDAGESCDGVDNNCDGRIDEVCACVEGATQACFAGDGRNRGIGPCVQGTQTCSGGQWGACSGSGAPATETCDGVDNDCDGPADEEVTQDCYTGPTATRSVGVCKAGAQVCREGKFQGFCAGEVLPSPERCNNLDDNCSGSTDEALLQACFDGPASARNVGACRDGTQTCLAGAWATCSGQVLPASESCNNIDDDCDGRRDEALSRNCYNGPAGTAGVGRCRAGTETCDAGSYGTCVSEILPTPESCNNADDNCNGQTDEALTQACYTGPAGTRSVGLCADGTQTCLTGGTFGACTGQTLPAVEACNNNLDEDCDGRRDEGCAFGDSCSYPGAISTASPVQSIDDVIDAGQLDDFSGCGTTGSRDFVYAFTVNQTERVVLTASPDAGFDVALQLRSGATCSSSASLSCTNLLGAAGIERLNRVLQPGSYYAVIETGTANQGGFNLALSRGGVVDGDTCQNAFYVDGGIVGAVDGGIQTFFGDTANDAGNDVTFTGCGDPSSPELVYTVELPAARTLSLFLDAGTWAPAVAVRTGATCPGSVAAACSSSGVVGSRSLTVDLPAGRHDIVVRGATPTAAGQYQLDVRFGGQLTYVESVSPLTYIDACTGGTNLPVSNDSSNLTTLPFDFPFWGTTRFAGSTVYVMSNGYLSFTSSVASVSPNLGSAALPNSVVAPFWEHIHTSGTGVCQKVLGTAPNRQWVLEWRNGYFWSFGTTVNFEAVLSESTGTIDFIYTQINGAGGVGVENDTGTRAVTRTTGVTNGTAIRFSPTVP